MSPAMPAYATLRKGAVARTVAVTDSINVDVDADDLILGVETLDGESWQSVLESLAMAGRLAIPRRKTADARSDDPGPIEMGRAW